MRRVLIVSREAPPAVGPHSIRVAKLVKYLPSAGWEPTLLTTPLDHAWATDSSLIDDLADAPVIRIPRLLARVLRPTYKVEAVGSGGPADARTRTGPGAKSWPRSILSGLLIPDRDILWAVAVVRHRGLDLSAFDAVLTTAPPFSTHLVGAWMARSTGLPWVAEYRDNWTTNPLYQRRVPRGPAERWLERAILRYASTVVAMSAPAAEELTHGLHLDRTLVHVAANGFDPDDLPPASPRPGRFEITYLGTLDERRDPRPFFTALARRCAIDPEFRIDARVRFVGNIRPWVPEAARAVLGDGQIHDEGLVPHRDALAFGARAAVLLGITTRAEAGEVGLTSKLFEYLGLRRPILMLAPKSPARELVERLHAGETADPDDVEAIDAALAKLYAAWRHGSESAIPPGSLLPFTRLGTAQRVAAALDSAVRG